VDKYFTLYRRDRVTKNCIAGGYLRLAIYRDMRGSEELSTAMGDSVGDASSVENVSVCSSARDQAFPFSHPYEAEIDSLPARPSSAVPRMLVSEDFVSSKVFIWLKPA